MPVGRRRAGFKIAFVRDAEGTIQLSASSEDTESQVTEDDLWGCWTLLANRLSNSSGLTPAKRLMCQTVDRAVQNALHYQTLPDTGGD